MLRTMVWRTISPALCGCISLLISSFCSRSCHSACDFEKAIGTPGRDEGFCVQNTEDGGSVIVGFTTSPGLGAQDVYLIKTNGKGDSVWTKTFVSNYQDFGQYVQQEAEGGTWEDPYAPACCDG
jgi:hypothetical protein